MKWQINWGDEDIVFGYDFSSMLEIALDYFLTSSYCDGDQIGWLVIDDSMSLD